MEDLALKKKLDDMGMSEDEYIKHMSILDFHDFIKTQKQNILDDSIKQYMEDVSNYISNKTIQYGDKYKEYFEHYSSIYLMNLQKETYDTSMSTLKNDLKVYIQQVNQDYLKLKNLNTQEKISYTKNIINKLDKNHANMYINLLKIRHSADESLKEEDIQIFKI